MRFLGSSILFYFSYATKFHTLMINTHNVPFHTMEFCIEVGGPLSPYTFSFNEHKLFLFKETTHSGVLIYKLRNIVSYHIIIIHHNFPFVFPHTNCPSFTNPLNSPFIYHPPVTPHVWPCITRLETFVWLWYCCHWIVFFLDHSGKEGFQIFQKRSFGSLCNFKTKATTIFCAIWLHVDFGSMKHLIT